MASEETLKRIGSEWNKNGMCRIYFNDLQGLYGLKLSLYHTGNISSASLDGEPISNSSARKICSALAGKLWFDCNDGKFYSRDLGPNTTQKLIATIETRAAAMEASHATV